MAGVRGFPGRGRQKILGLFFPLKTFAHAYVCTWYLRMRMCLSNSAVCHPLLPLYQKQLAVRFLHGDVRVLSHLQDLLL